MACAHPRFKRVVVRNPMEVWYDRICCACGERVPWPKVAVAVTATLRGAGAAVGTVAPPEVT